MLSRFTMAGRINELDTSLSAHICASQVIEDLSSAVKEMIENALVFNLPYRHLLVV